MLTITQTLNWCNRHYQNGKDLLFPPQCVVCQQWGYLLCPTCAQSAEPVGDSICARCGRRQPTPTACCANCQQQAESALLWVRAATIHHGAIRQAIHVLKYEAKPEMAPLLAPYLVAVFGQAPWATLQRDIEAVVPVPLHAERLATRGYNQAELLARAFCQRVKLPLHPEWLQRQQYTQSQVGLNREQRQANVADAFGAAPAVAGRTFLLLDDVYTTGATLQACAKAARLAGARQIFALTLATADHFDFTGDQPLNDQAQTWSDGA